MALILSQSPPHSASNLMYSFLKPVHKEQRQNSETQSHQRNEDALNHLPSHDIQCDIENVNQLAIHTNADHDGIGDLGKDEQNIFVDISSTGHNFDSSSDRRKRRKISAESDGASKQSTLDFRSPASGSDCDQKTVEFAREKGINGVETTTKPTQPSSVTPKKPRGRPPKSAKPQRQATIADETPSGTGGHAQCAIILGTPSSKPTGSASRNSLKINSTGKLALTNSEVQNITSPKTSKRAAVTSGHSVRKVTVKNGRFTPSLVVVLRYLPGLASPDSIGSRVQSVLARPSEIKRQNDSDEASSRLQLQAKRAMNTTHPFFRGKKGPHFPNQPPVNSTLSSENCQIGDQTVSENKKPVAWKDIVFKSVRPPTSKELQLEKAPWPPTAYQHIQGNEDEPVYSPLGAQRREKKKDKIKPVSIAESENIMNVFGKHLLRTKDSCSLVCLPQRLYLSRKDALSSLPIDCGQASNVPAVEAARQKALTAYSAFDRAEAAGSTSWSQQYSPSTWAEVLQPSCDLLYDWLKSLAVHTIKQSIDTSQLKRPAKRRKRVKKKEDDLLDFIVSDDEDTEVKKVKNAVLIIGPNGCGKTAAVYAVAKQLGFEVFEIHPGMRRSQKDIIDKVGDMAQNHMVQRGQTLSRDSSVACEMDNASGQDDHQQPSVASIFAQSNKNKLLEVPKMNTTLPPKQEQKQSLILFEEVDHLFEEDRGFWSGVQGLIQNSKRPVVLTCNTMPDIPLDELDLHQILTFTAPPVEIVVPYLTLIAAAEGHAIDPKAIEALYRTKNEDLRATITNLDFWCQMTVGSEKGGLDWYPSTNERSQMVTGDRDLRTFSANTFQRGLDQIPTMLSTIEDELQYAENCFDISPEDFFEGLSTSLKSNCCQEATTVLSQIAFRSDGDVISSDAKQDLYVQLYEMENNASRGTGRDHMLQVLSREPKISPYHIDYHCLLPLASERPVFPPGHSRLAPSLDVPRATLAEDVAPYIRSIAAFDQRLEQAREELFSSQGKKTRTTRAARAAAEGGDKANTRRERWFPKDLDLQAVMATGNNWPQWHEGQVSTDELSSSPAESADDLTQA